MTKASPSPEFIFLCCREVTALASMKLQSGEKVLASGSVHRTCLTHGGKSCRYLSPLECLLSTVITCHLLCHRLHFPPERVLSGCGPWLLGPEPVLSQLGRVSCANAVTPGVEGCRLCLSSSSAVPGGKSHRWVRM